MEKITKLPRKIDQFLLDWKNNPNHMPLIVKGARQIGKTSAIEFFAEGNYANVIEINFALQPEYKAIFERGFTVDVIIREISLINPTLKFIPGETLLFFDELQDCPNLATALKSFNEDGRFDVICSGSMMGINYHEIESNSVGNKQDYEMYSMDFEEFLWAKGYTDEQINYYYQHMLDLEPLSTVEMDVMTNNFREYMVLGGMPRIVASFVENGNFAGTLDLQRQIILDYEEDITKYASGMDKTRILNVYRKIPVFLGNENKKFQISKVENGARTREYSGAIEWLEAAGIINVSHAMAVPELPLKGNYNPDNYRVYFSDTGLLIGSLDEEAQEDIRNNKNFNTYKGAIYENIMAETLKKQGQELFFYKNEKSTLELDFVVRDANSLVPIEMKATDSSSVSMNNMIDSEKYPDIEYGVKFALKNIGYNGKYYTFPYFLAFLLRRWLKDKK